MKSYTDISQSKKLAEILPLESADMIYTMVNGYHTPFIRIETIEELDEDDVLCWSLAALLGMLRTFTTPTAFSVKVSAPSLIKIKNGYKLTYTGDYTPMISNELDVEAPIESIADNPVDACVDMIIKLNKLNLL